MVIYSKKTIVDKYLFFDYKWIIVRDMDVDNLGEVWRGVEASLKISVSIPNYVAYLKNLKLNSLTETGERMVAEISCPTAFIKNTVEGRFWGQINLELERISGRKCELKFVVESGTPLRQGSGGQGLDGPLFEVKKSNEEWRKSRLLENYTFDNYAVAGSNQMAYAAAIAVTKKLGSAYNPLFIYGGVGVGKTHLMQAVGHEAIKNGEDRVLFCPGEEFTNDLVEAIRLKSTEKVRAKYRRLKLLMIDDVQFIAGKPTIQEEFFHTFNALQQGGAQIIMTSDRPPIEINKLEERLKSRFGAGLIVDIGPADFELRTAILLIKAKQQNFSLPMDWAQLIASQIEGARLLEGFLTKLISHQDLTHSEVTREVVEQLLKNGNSRSVESRMIVPADVINIVSDYYHIPVAQLKGERRLKNIVWPRQVLMYLLHTYGKLPLEEVGRLIGGRDHTTVIHANGKVNVEIKTNMNIAAEVETLKKKVGFFNSL